MINYYIIPIFVPHRGCPHDCVFCNQKKITGSKRDITSSDVENIISTYLSTMDRENSYIEVSFFGGSFTGIPIEYQNELLIPAKNAKRNKSIDAIRLSTRPDYIDEKILNNLRAYDVDVIELGVQSMDITVLNASERGHSCEDVINASHLIKKYGFKLGLQMMIGLPLDSREKDLYTASKIIELKPDFVRIYPTLVIKATELENQYKSGKYMPLTVDEAVDICKELYILFTLKNIQIIRLGLQPTEQISLEGDVIAGPFHPAFRELIEASILNDMIEYIVQRFYENSSDLNIEICPKDISKLYADKKRYFMNMKQRLKHKNINIRQDTSVERFNLKINDGKKEIIMSIYEYIKLVN